MRAKRGRKAGVEDTRPWQRALQTGKDTSSEKEINQQKSPLFAGQSTLFVVCFASEGVQRERLCLSASSAHRQLKAFSLMLKYEQLLSQHESGKLVGAFFLICLHYLGIAKSFVIDRTYSAVSHLPCRPALTRNPAKQSEPQAAPLHPCHCGLLFPFLSPFLYKTRIMLPAVLKTAKSLHKKPTALQGPSLTTVLCVFTAQAISPAIQLAVKIDR